jgi:hypothetical protein
MKVEQAVETTTRTRGGNHEHSRYLERKDALCILSFYHDFFTESLTSDANLQKKIKQNQNRLCIMTSSLTINTLTPHQRHMSGQLHYDLVTGTPNGKRYVKHGNLTVQPPL